MEKAWLLTENGFAMAAVFDEELADEIAAEYGFDTEEIEFADEVN